MRKIVFLLLCSTALSRPQILQPAKAQGATAAVIEAFANHDIVMLADGTLINKNTNGYGSS